MSSAAVSDEGKHAACLDAEDLVELARGSLDPAKREAALAHLRVCAECSEVLRLWTGADLSQPASSASHPAGEAGARRPPGPGDVLASKYRVERILGIGGMGVVVAATHLQLGRPVALKLMLPESAASSDAAARFIQEARAAAEVQSEHVVRVLDVGSLDDGSPFMVMEFLRGTDLARVLRTHGPLPVVDVVGYVLQACDAVSEAHSLGIVHRDLKPANLFLTTRPDESPLVKVLDFGISKLTRRGASADASLTKSRSIMGTPLYMSPEQLRETRAVGPATDIWALGCILYELLAGRPAFFAGTAHALGALIATGPAPRIREVRADVPSGVEDAILCCLEKEPSARFASIGDLAHALGPFAPQDMNPLVARIGRISARPFAQLPFADTITSSDRPPRFAATGGALARSGSASTSRPGGAALLPWAVAGVLAAGLLGLALSRGSRSASPTAASTTAPAAGAGTTAEVPPIAAAPEAGGVAAVTASAETPAPPVSATTAPKKPARPSKSSEVAAPASARAKAAEPSKDRDAIE